jgi:hypothetical protein
MPPGGLTDRPWLKAGHIDAERLSMEFGSCPYDASAVAIEEREDGSTLVSCSTCGAVWELHNQSLKSLSEPDRAAARAARAARAERAETTHASNPPEQGSAEDSWRRVRSAIVTICHEAERTPPADSAR